MKGINLIFYWYVILLFYSKKQKTLYSWLVNVCDIFDNIVLRVWSGSTGLQKSFISVKL